MQTRASQDLRQRAVLVCTLWLMLWFAGCAAPLSVPSFRDQAMSMQQARDALVIGASTKADVQVLLGPATVVRLDSGYEVWVYGMKAASAGIRQTEYPAGRAEFVILFSPAGVVSKVRQKPAYTSGG